MEPHQIQFSAASGPSGPAVIQVLTQILRAGNPMPTQRDNPRKRGPGKGEYERVSAHFEPSPGAFCLLFRHGKRRSPPGTRAVRTIKLSLAAKLETLRGGAPSRGPGQLLLPLRGNSPSRALHKKPLYHRPLIRPFGPPSPGEGLKRAAKLPKNFTFSAEGGGAPAPPPGRRTSCPPGRGPGRTGR